MTQHQLGRHAAARATLARLREIIQKDADRWANDADAQAFLREAEALIESAASKPND
jgi:hypothetical protein